MNLGQMKTALQRFGFDTNDPLTTWLNAAMHDFEDAAEWSFLLKQTTIVGNVGDSSLILPTDFFKVMSIRNSTDGAKLKWVDTRQFDSDVFDFTVPGPPTTYTTLGQTVLRIYPVLDTSTTFVLTYESELLDMVNDADVPGIPLRYHYSGIVQGAAAIALQAENEEERSTAARALFDSAVGRAVLRFSGETLDEFKTVRDVQEYGDS